MQAEYANLLTPVLAELVRETEAHIGFPIEVVVRQRRSPRRADGVIPLACEVEKNSARLLTPSVHQLSSPGAVFHELLHIRRFLVEGVPRLVDCDDYEAWTPDIGTALTAQDNGLEHLVIVPHELREFPERRTHWETVMERVWAEIDAGDGREEDRKQGGMACWAFLRLVVPDSPTVDIARRALTRMNLMQNAEQFCEALSPTLEDKVAAVSVWFEHLAVPLEMASLEYLFPRELRSRKVPLVRGA